MSQVASGENKVKVSKKQMANGERQKLDNKQNGSKTTTTTTTVTIMEKVDRKKRENE